jgi:hypothetical protein
MPTNGSIPSIEAQMNKKYVLIIIAGIMIIVVALILACASDHISNPNEVPATPTDLIGGGLSSSDIILNWQDNSNNENGFYLYRRLAVLRDWTKIAILAENTVSFTDHGLVDSTEYTYYVSAFNAGGESPASATVTVTTRGIGFPPESPHNQVPWNGADTVARNCTLFWQCSDPDGDPLIYDTYLGTRTPPGVLDTANADTLFAVRNLLADTVYYWQVTARDPHKHRTSSPIWWFRTAR